MYLTKLSSEVPALSKSVKAGENPKAKRKKNANILQLLDDLWLNKCKHRLHASENWIIFMLTFACISSMISWCAAQHCYVDSESCGILTAIFLNLKALSYAGVLLELAK